jgi:hypothetical protein
MARDAKISLQPDQTLTEVNEVEISDSNARGRDPSAISLLNQKTGTPSKIRSQEPSHFVESTHQRCAGVTSIISRNLSSTFGSTW